jgi:CzcA family heavy metal efflux pump
VKSQTSTLVLLLVFMFSMLGVFLASTIPSAVFPEFTFRRAIILADSGDLPADQMLATVTRPIEEAAYSVVGISLVRSTTTRGSAEIDVTFSDNADPRITSQLLESAIGEARSRMPEGTTADTLLLTTGTFPILDVSLSSNTRELAELTDIAKFDLVPAIHRIDGTYRVEVVGGKNREFVVRIDPARMLQHSLSPSDVVDGLAKNNVMTSAGRVYDAHRMLLTVVATEMHQSDQIAAVPIANIGGQPVRVRDIGSVEMGLEEDFIRTTSEHGSAVLVGISRRPEGDTVTIARQARAIINDFRARYPDVTFSISYDQSSLIKESFQSVRDAIALGLVLAVMVVLLFTMSPLNGLIAAIVVPCTVAITGVVMKAAGLTFNMMTLGGLAAGIGLFIDDAIVMIEAIHRARADGESIDAAIATALTRLGRPLFASTMTVIIVFAPLVFMSGVTGTFFRSLAATLGGGLAISLLLAIYFTPALEVLLERFRGASHPPGIIFRAIQRLYAIVLMPFVSLPVIAPLVAILAISGAWSIYHRLGTDYLPPLDEGAFVLDYVTPSQSTMSDTTALLATIEEVLRSTPEVASFSRRTGTQLGFFLTESNRGDFSVRLRPDRDRRIDDVIAAVRARILNSLPGVHIEFSQMLQDLIGDLSGTPEPIEIKVFGPNPEGIQATAHRVAATLSGIPGVVDIFDGIVKSLPVEQFEIDQTAAARYGLSADEIHRALETVIEGTVATNVLTGDRLLAVRVRYPDAFHEDLGTLSEVLLSAPSGARVPLSAVTKPTFIGDADEIDRERERPVLHVTARLEGIDLGTGVSEVRRRLGALELPAGVTLEYGGLYAQQREAFAQLTIVLVSASFAMFLILVWEFTRLGPALACMVAALSCLFGSLLALYLTDTTLDISSFMGIIMVVGITAKNGILLLDHAEHEMIEGTAATQALLQAASVRLRPIVMTTLATAAGLFPLALGYGAGAKVQQPLAIAVIGGLAFAMIMSTPLAGGIYLLTTRGRRRSDPTEFIQ